MLPTPNTLHGSTDIHKETQKTGGSGKPNGITKILATRDYTISWGRHHRGSWFHALGCASIMAICPVLVIFYWISLSSFQGSLAAALEGMREFGPLDFFSTYAPRPSLQAGIGYVIWLLFQAALYQFLPSVLSTGQLTPAGNLLQYRTNGLLAWFVTHGLFLAFSLYGILDMAVLARNWEGLLVVSNVFGFVLTGVAYIKARMSPSHEEDRKFSGEFSEKDPDEN